MPTQEARTQNTKMRISIISFGFKHGLPPESNLLIDVRFVPNPYYVPELKDLDGTDARVRQFVKQWTGIHEFFEKYFALIGYLIPLYEKEGKTQLTLAAGCTGGRHRSLVIAEEIFADLKYFARDVSLTHRDIGLG